MSRWVLVTRDQCPPEDTPLVSSIDELAQDKARIDEWKAKATASFPGREASFDDKLKWYHSSSESVYDDFMSGAPEPHEFLPAVLLDACDDSVELQLIIKRSHVKKLNEIGAEEKAIFMASAERARNPAAGQIDIARWVYIADSDAQARAETEEAIVRHIAHFGGIGTAGYLGSVSEKGTQLSYDELLNTTLLHGSAETVIARLREMQARTGMTSLLLHYPPYYGREKTMKSLKLFAERVIPAFRPPAQRVAAAE